MSEETRGSASAASFPDAPTSTGSANRPSAGSRELRKSDPDAKLADAQFDLAKQYGFASWRALKAHVDSLTVEGQLFDAARNGDVDALDRPARRASGQVAARNKPYEWTLLHAAARRRGSLAAVDLLLERGLDVNTREKGDNTYADALGGGGGTPRRRAATGRRRRRRRRPRRRSRARGNRMGDVLGRLRRRRASRHCQLPHQPRRASPHLLGDRDESRRRSASHRRGRPNGAEQADESEREPSASDSLRGAHESRRRWWRCCSRWAPIPPRPTTPVPPSHSTPRHPRSGVTCSRRCLSIGRADVFTALAVGDEAAAARLMADGRLAGSAFISRQSAAMYGSEVATRSRRRSKRPLDAIAGIEVVVRQFTRLVQHRVGVGVEGVDLAGNKAGANSFR